MQGTTPSPHHQTIPPGAQHNTHQPTCSPYPSSIQMADFDPLSKPTLRHQTSGTYTAHHLKDVPTFCGSSGKKHGLRVEDCARDMRFLLELKGPQAERVRFQEVVRHTKADARDVVLNLESRGTTTAEEAISELLDEFGEGCTAATPIANFFSRRQRSEETAIEYAIALETLLRNVEDIKRRQRRQGSLGEDRDVLLTTQFMSGLHDNAVRQRLAPMQPRCMSFKTLRKELRVINEEFSQVREARRYQYSIHQQTTEADNSTSQHQKTKKEPEMKLAQSHNQVTPNVNGQLEELTKMMKQHMSTLDQVVQGQHSLGQRVHQIESALSRQGPPQAD